MPLAERDHPPATVGIADAVVLLVLCAATVIYLSALPHNLGFADESYFLYEAKRIRDGEVLYRDIFQIVTPISPYLMAACFWLFGSTMTTARVAAAVVHALIVAGTYASARLMRVGAPLAAVAAVSHVALNQPAWPFASWHWFSTATATAILFLLLRHGSVSSPRSLLALGAWCGLFICIQQQRGLIPTVGAACWLVTDALIDRWYGDTRALTARLLTRLGIFAAGVLLVAVPILLLFVALAGGEALYHALVRFPTQNYRATYRTTWGSVIPLSRVYAGDTFPSVLRLLPVVLIIPLLRCGADVLRRRERERTRGIGALVVTAIFAALSIWYYPDFIHIAFIAVPFLVSAVVSIQWLLDAVPARIARAGTYGIALIAVTGMAYHLAGNWTAKWSRYPHSAETAFGRIDYAAPWEPLLMQAVRSRIAATPSHELFCYPSLAAPYLTTGAKNPTPFQYFHAPVFPARDVARVIAVLQQRRVPYILAAPTGLGPQDPIRQEIDRHYTYVDLPEFRGLERFPSLWLYARKPETQ